MSEPRTIDEVKDDIRSRVGRRAPFLYADRAEAEEALDKIKTFDGEDWAEAWKKHYTILHLGKHIVVKPSWLEYAPAPDEVIVELDPGMAEAMNNLGFLFHQGRSKEILKIGGQRVSPVEIEQVVAEHPTVAEAAVVGIPDALKGEVPVAYVVTRPGCTLDPAALVSHCRARMALYRVPVRFTAVAALPRNEAGKLLRARLAELAPGEGPGEAP